MATSTPWGDRRVIDESSEEVSPRLVPKTPRCSLVLVAQLEPLKPLYN